MASAMLNLSIIEKRMLRAAEAAAYSGLPVKHFEQVCTVQPVELRPGTRLYDRRDLDQWIDGIKDGTAAVTRDDILGKL